MSSSVKMPLSPTTMRSDGIRGASSSLTLERDLEGAQVPVVDADELGAERQGAVQLRPVVHLDQHVHAEIVSGVDQRAGLVVRDARHDDEDAVGAPGAGLVDLIGLEQEILAQGRQAGGLAGLGEVFGLALERGLVGENGEAGRAALRIGACARLGGSKSARIRPFEGLAFFTSAMSAGRPSARWRSMAFAKPRGGEAARARRSISACGIAAFAAAISWRL